MPRATPPQRSPSVTGSAIVIGSVFQAGGIMRDTKSARFGMPRASIDGLISAPPSAQP